METPKPPGERGPEEPPSADPPPSGPRAPAGTPPPPPSGPQAPAGTPPPPAGPQAPFGAPETPASYGDPVPPGGWEQPIVAPPSGWRGRPLASWGTRLAAYLIDGLILLVPVIILTLVVVAVATNSGTGAWVTAVLGFLVYLAALLLYAPILMARQGPHNGQTWGKQLLDIRVVRDNGEPMSLGSAALREIVVKGFLVTLASSIIPFIPWFLDYFWPLWDDENRALHDMVVSTHVVQG